MYKIFILTLFLLTSIVCYRADNTIATDEVDCPLDSEIVVEFSENRKKCNCEKDKTDKELEIENTYAEQASKALTTAFIANSDDYSYKRTIEISGDNH